MLWSLKVKVLSNIRESWGHNCGHSTPVFKMVLGNHGGLVKRGHPIYTQFRLLLRVNGGPTCFMNRLERTPTAEGEKKNFLQGGEDPYMDKPGCVFPRKKKKSC